MTERTWSIAMVRLSDSFQAAVGDLAARLGAGVVEWTPVSGGVFPADAALVLVVAGGEEAAALDLVGTLPRQGELPCYVIGAATDHRLAASMVQRGARDYFALPGDFDLLRRSLERERREAAGRAEAARFVEAERRTSGFAAIIGRSAALHATLDQAARVAVHADVTVLVHGETGTGKELLARAIHYHSPRAHAPFVEINCAAIPENLLESELFGHEKGAFTGAIAAKPGLFELAHGGTLFLDEVGTLPLQLQPKLLRALENRMIRRVGGTEARRIDIRLVAATHVDLAAAAQRGEFREDLFYRLNVVALTLPPLRRRDGDIALLAEVFIAQLSAAYGLPAPPLTPEVCAALHAHSWPGNVRELRNAVERALVLSPRGTLLASELVVAPAAAVQSAGAAAIPFPADVQTILQAAVRAMLVLTNGNKTEAARRLGMSRPRLHRLLSGQGDSNN